MKRFILAVLLALSVAAPTLAYTVKPGDTLWSLYGNNWQKVASENNISDPRKLQVGTKLSEPGFGGSSDLLGVSIPNSPALIDTYLASGIDADDTSMTLANGTTRAGTTLSGYMCFTLDVNTPVVEYVCGTANGTSVTGLLRGVDLSNPNTTSSALAFSHRRFASVQVSDYPLLAILTRILQGLDTTPGGIQFGTGTIYGATSALLSSQTSSLANVDYVNNVATSGAPNASTVTKGLVQEATQANLMAGTATGTTGARLFIPIAMTTSVAPYNTSTAGMLIRARNSDGELDSSWCGNPGSCAQLDANQKVVQNPANATTTPTTANIPIATASGTIREAWIATSTNQKNLTGGDFLRSTSTGAYWGQLGTTSTDLTSGRSLNTTYQNTTTQSIFLTVTVTLSSVNTAVSALAILYVSGTSTPGIEISRALNNNQYTSSLNINVPLTAIVPPGHYYRINSSGSGTTAINTWVEQRI